VNSSSDCFPSHSRNVHYRCNRTLLLCDFGEDPPLSLSYSLPLSLPYSLSSHTPPLPAAFPAALLQEQMPTAYGCSGWTMSYGCLVMRGARSVFLGKLSCTKPFVSLPVTLRDLMRKDVLLLHSGGGHMHGRHWYQQCMEKAAWRTALIWCLKVLHSMRGLEVDWSGSQGPRAL
jgi:hypothetical protein